MKVSGRKSPGSQAAVGMRVFLERRARMMRRRVKITYFPGTSTKHSLARYSKTRYKPRSGSWGERRWGQGEVEGVEGRETSFGMYYMRE